MKPQAILKKVSKSEYLREPLAILKTVNKQEYPGGGGWMGGGGDQEW